ncbi:MAG: hypothetical protein ACTSUE_00310 [Promethearchaeota archaeon]
MNRYYPLKVGKVGELDINDKIWDSLRRDYGTKEFNKWLTDKSDRDAIFHYSSENELGTILIYKFENEDLPQVIPPRKTKRRLKICTMKVERNDQGKKIGELLLKIAHHLAIEQNIDEIYVTHFTEQPEDHLVCLLEKFGFYKDGFQMTNGKEEDVFFKDLAFKRDNPLFSQNKKFTDIFKFFYPSIFDGPEVGKFFLPIRPEWHEKLFTDCPVESGRNKTLDEFAGKPARFPHIEGNTIRKAYLCHATTRRVKPGDLLLVFRSQDIRSLTTIGTVDEIHYELENLDEIFKIVRKRTVYTKDEIKEMLEKPQPLVVILFWQNFHLKREAFITRKTMEDKGILTPGSGMSITEIPHDRYTRLKRSWDVPNRLITSNVE